jgi:hypothetical protein
MPVTFPLLFKGNDLFILDSGGEDFFYLSCLSVATKMILFDGCAERAAKADIRGP